MRQTLHVALHDLRLHLVDKSSFFFLLIMPLGFIFFFGTVFRDGSGPQMVSVSLPVVNEDEGFLGSAFVEQLRSESFDLEVYSAAAADTVEFETRVARIPKDFTQKILAGEKGKVTLTKRPGSNVTYDAAASMRLHQAQVRFLGNLVRWNPPEPVAVEGTAGSPLFDGDSSQAGDEPDAQFVPPELSAVDKGKFLALVAEPSRVEVKSEHAGSGRPVPSGMGQSVPGILAMFVVMTVLIGGSEAITKEKSMGTLRRLATTTLSRGQILGGKLGGLMFLGLAQAAILILTTEILGRVGILGMTFVWGANVIPLMPLLIAYCFCVASIGLFLSGVFRTTQQAESLSWLVGMVFAGLGGCWWPMEIVPRIFQKIGHIFPTAWAMDGLHGVITFGDGISAVVGPSVVLVLYGLVFFALGARTMRLAS